MIGRLLAGIIVAAAPLGGCGADTPPAAAPAAPAPEATAPPEPAPPPEPVAAPAPEPIPVEAPPPPQPEPAPAAPPAASPAPEAPPVTLNRARADQIHEGMSYEEVRAALGAHGAVVSRSDLRSAVYRWTDASGASILARFDDDKLARKISVQLAEDEADSAEAPRLSKEDYDKISVDMTLEEALAALDIEARPVADNKVDVAVYRWMDPHGSSFTARFEDGKLVRKTGLFVAPAENKDEKSEEEPAENAAESGDTEDAPAQEEVEGSGEGAIAEGAPEEERRVITREDLRPWEERAPATEEAAEAPQRDPRIRVAGSTRRAREAAEAEAAGRITSTGGRGRSANAKLPKFTYGLKRGVFEMRIYNPGESAVRVGVRSGKLGKDLRIAAGGDTLLKVDRGAYELYFIYDDDPGTVHRGQGITINGGDYLADCEIHLMNKSYDVRTLTPDFYFH